MQGRRLTAVHDPLTGKDLQAGFLFEGERSPLVNPQRGIFKPKQMRFLLSIKTVFPRPGSKIWYDDQREVHRQIFAGDETVEYAFMGPGSRGGRQSLATRGVRASAPNDLFPGHRPQPLPGPAAGLHLRLGRQGLKGACRVRCIRSRDPEPARERTGTAVCPASRQAAAASSLVPRSHHQRL